MVVALSVNIDVCLGQDIQCEIGIPDVRRGQQAKGQIQYDDKIIILSSTFCTYLKRQERQ